jgi:hypothetical protein
VEEVFVCVFDDARCISIPVSAAPSTLAPTETVPTPSSSAFSKALRFVACLVLGPLII